MKLITVFAVVVLLSGCAMSSGVLSTGKDTYSVSVAAAPARGGMAGAKRIAYGEAAEKCASMGRQMVLIKEGTETTNRAGAGTADIQFACIAEDDPDYQRRRTSPDIVIENR